jgi:LytS/YehU family sensor histidine kinase
MSGNEETIIVILTIILIGWLILKLRKEKKINKSLENENNLLVKENSKLLADNAVLEFEHLKFQLEPHTLGNVVSTLTAVAKNLHKGTESLGSSLNYILYKGNKILVSVEDEINFTKKYIQLHDFLSSDILSVDIDDSQVDSNLKHYSTPSIPHLITAYLIENAYKHGDKSHPDFLKIKFKLTDKEFEMSVINRVPKEVKSHKDGGVGLKNMEKRLELLMNDKYKITRELARETYSSTIKIIFD